MKLLWTRALAPHRAGFVHATLAQGASSYPLQLQGLQAGEQLAHHLATHDPLTALPNRSGLCEQFERALSRAGALGQMLAVMHIDLGNLVSVLPSAEHELLRIVARRLSHTLGVRDVLGRLGGEAFAGLVAGAEDRAQLSRLASQMLHAVAAPMTLGELRLTLRPSIGIAMHPMHGLRPEQLLHSADVAMYNARRAHTGHAFFHG